MLNGLKINVSHALGPRQVQIKRHKRNKRIDKKWLKRYGTTRAELRRAIGRHL